MEESGATLTGEAQAPANPQSKDTAPAKEPKHIESADLDRLYRACLEKFLSYSVVSAATFVGYVELAINVHNSSETGLPSVIPKLIVLALAFVFAGAVSAAARQFYLISLLEGHDRLGVRDLERSLTKVAAPIVINTMTYSHAAEESATTGRINNALTIAWGLLVALALLVLIYALL